jgi:hypothetical protein
MAGSDDTSIPYCVARFGVSKHGRALRKTRAPPSRIAIFPRPTTDRCNGASNPIIGDTSINAMTDAHRHRYPGRPCRQPGRGSMQDNGFDALGLLAEPDGRQHLRIRGATGAADCQPFILTRISRSPSGSLTIQPGVNCRNGRHRSAGTLTMNGTPRQPDRLRRSRTTTWEPNDTNNDGSVSRPPAAISQIEFQPARGSIATRPRSADQHNEGVIRCMNVSPPISNCTVSDTHYESSRGSEFTSPTSPSTTVEDAHLHVGDGHPAFSDSRSRTTRSHGSSTTISTNSVLPVRNVAGYNNITYWLSGTSMAVGRAASRRASWSRSTTTATTS